MGTDRVEKRIAGVLFQWRTPAIGVQNADAMATMIMIAMSTARRQQQPQQPLANGSSVECAALPRSTFMGVTVAGGSLPDPPEAFGWRWLAAVVEFLQPANDVLCGVVLHGVPPIVMVG